jgi:hypothetical protein
MPNAVSIHFSGLLSLTQFQSETETREAFLENLKAEVLAPLLTLRVRAKNLDILRLARTSEYTRRHKSARGNASKKI